MVGTNVWDSKRIDSLVESAQKLTDRLAEVANEYMVSDIWDNDDPDYAALRDNMIAPLNREVKMELEAATNDKTRYTDLVKIAECYQTKHLNPKALINEMDSHNRPDVERIIVHDEVFHADDVMCVAMAKTLNPDVEVVRTRNLDKKDIAMNGHGTYIADVGGGKYDHHQEGAAVRDDGNQYAACGLLYKEWKDDLFPQNDANVQKYFEEVFIKPIEQADNGIAPNSLSSAIGSLVPSWRETDVNINDRFNEAVDFVQFVVEKTQELAEHQADKVLHGEGKPLDSLIPEILPNIHNEAEFQTHLKEFAKTEIDQDKGRDLGADIARFAKPNHDLLSHTFRKVLGDGVKDRYFSVHVGRDGETHCNTFDADKNYHLAWNLFDHAQEQTLAIIDARDQVMEVYENSKNKEIVSLPQYMPWIEMLSKPELEAKFVVFPSTGGDIKLQCVPPSPDSFDKKVPLPSEWLTEKPEGCTFVHRERFIAGFDIVEHAVKAAESVLEKERNMERGNAEKEYEKAVVESLDKEFQAMNREVEELKEDEYYKDHSDDRELKEENLAEEYNKDVMDELNKAIDRGVDREGLEEIAGNMISFDPPEKIVSDRLEEIEYEQKEYEEAMKEEEEMVPGDDDDELVP